MQDTSDHKAGQSSIVVIVDYPNSHNLDLKRLSIHAHQKDPTCRLYLVVPLRTSEGLQRLAGSLGYRIITQPKDDVDPIIQDLINESMDRRTIPTEIILGAGDRDYIDGIKNILRTYRVKITLAVGTSKYARLYKSIGLETLFFSLNNSY